MNTKILFSVVLASTLMIQGCGQLTKALQDQLAANTTRISGKATLSGASDNSGIIIKMGKQVSASTQSLIMTKSVSLNLVTVAQTGSSGDYSFDVTGKTSAQSLSIQTQELNLDTGMYTVVFSKDGYESVTVDNVPVILGQSVYNMDAVSLVIKEQIFEFTSETGKLLVLELSKDHNPFYEFEIMNDSIYDDEDEITTELASVYTWGGNSGLVKDIKVGNGKDGKNMVGMLNTNDTYKFYISVKCKNSSVIKVKIIKSSLDELKKYQATPTWNVN